MQGSLATSALEESVQKLTSLSHQPTDQKGKMQEKFQEFMAGTFYGQMVKALRSGQQKPAYFHGGQAEEIFQGQMDQIVSENLAKTHGASFAEPMYRAYQQQRGITPQPTSQLDVTA